MPWPERFRHAVSAWPLYAAAGVASAAAASLLFSHPSPVCDSLANASEWMCSPDTRPPAVTAAMVVALASVGVGAARLGAIAQGVLYSSLVGALLGSEIVQVQIPRDPLSVLRFGLHDSAEHRSTLLWLSVLVYVAAEGVLAGISKQDAVPQQCLRGETPRTFFRARHTAIARGLAAHCDAIRRHVKTKLGELCKPGTSHHRYINLQFDAATLAHVDALRYSDQVRDLILDQFPDCVVRPISNTDELYVSNFNMRGGDNGLFTIHYDGNLRFFDRLNTVRVLFYIESPGCTTIDCLTSGTKATPRTGELLAIDFHKELHDVVMIDREGSRIALKTNFMVIPSHLDGSLSARLYEFLNRLVFFVVKAVMENSKAPRSPLEHALGAAAIVFRRLSNLHAGLAALPSILFLLATLLGAIDFAYLLLNVYTVITRAVGHKTFVRAAGALRSVTVLRIALRAAPFVAAGHWNLYGLPVAAAGLILHWSSLYALGVDRTYYGVELGVCEPRRVTSFPYNTGVPHPMLTGVVLETLGLALCVPGLFTSHAGFLALYLLWQLVLMAVEELADKMHYFFMQDTPLRMVKPKHV